MNDRYIVVSNVDVNRWSVHKRVEKIQPERLYPDFYYAHYVNTRDEADARVIVEALNAAAESRTR